MYYHARMYSPDSGRFLSADSFIKVISNPQNLNLYAYVLNNPVKYTDPSGHDVDCGIGDPRSCRNQAALDIRREHAFDGKYTTWDQLTPYEHKALIGHDTEQTWNGALDDRLHGGMTDVAGTFADPAMLIPLGGGVKIGISLGQQVLTKIGIACFASPMCRSLIPAPLPPGWNENWERMYGTQVDSGLHWFDELGGEWRWHDIDPWHSVAHWDYNPWTEWNSPWQNIYP